MLKMFFGDSPIVVDPLPDVVADTDELARIMIVVYSIAGSVALLMLAIGGYRYVLSRGDPNATAQAKNTILYSIIGLIVVIVAAAITAFIISAVA